MVNNQTHAFKEGDLYIVSPSCIEKYIIETNPDGSHTCGIHDSCLQRGYSNPGCVNAP